MKKTISILAVMALMVSMMSVTAFAHGGRGNSNGGCRNGNRVQQQSYYESCTVADCDVEELHEHNGVYYRCAYYGTEHECGRRCSQ